MAIASTNPPDQQPFNDHWVAAIRIQLYGQANILKAAAITPSNDWDPA